MSNSKLGSDVTGSAELKRVKSSGSATMEWNIPNFISLLESRDPNIKTVYQKNSPSFSIKCGQIERQFQLLIQASNEKDDSIGLYLRKLSKVDVEVKYQLTAINKSGTNFGIGGLISHKFTKDSLPMGYRNFFCLQKLKENSEDCLHNGSLKLGCEVTISDDEVSIEGYEGRTLRTDLENLKGDQTVSDFKITCKDQAFPCHKSILAARYFNKIEQSQKCVQRPLLGL